MHSTNAITPDSCFYTAWRLLMEGRREKTYSENQRSQTAGQLLPAHLTFHFYSLTLAFEPGQTLLGYSTHCFETILHSKIVYICKHCICHCRSSIYITASLCITDGTIKQWYNANYYLYNNNNNEKPLYSLINRTLLQPQKPHVHLMDYFTS